MKPFEKIDKTPDEIYNIDLLKAESEGIILNDNKPYFRKHSKLGILLIHGFAASPKELLSLAYLLEKQDYSVYVVRVAGHGSKLDDFYKTTYNDWYESISLGYNVLFSFCDKICILGQSNGGLLATMVAKFNKCDGLVLLAPAFNVRIFGFNLMPIARKFIKNIPRHIDNIDYNYKDFPTEQLYQMKLLQGEVSKYIKDIDVPVLLAISKHDIFIPCKKAIKQVNNMKSQDKTIITYDNIAYNLKHILTENHSIKIMNDILLWIEEKIR